MAHIQEEITKKGLILSPELDWQSLGAVDQPPNLLGSYYLKNVGNF